MKHLIYLREKGTLSLRCGKKRKLKKNERFSDVATVWSSEVTCRPCRTAMDEGMIP